MRQQQELSGVEAVSFFRCRVTAEIPTIPVMLDEEGTPQVKEKKSKKRKKVRKTSLKGSFA